MDVPVMHARAGPLHSSRREAFWSRSDLHSHPTTSQCSMDHHLATNGSSVELRPTQYLERKAHRNCDAKRKAALIVLNCPIKGPLHLERLYNHASFCICADGGANRLHDLLTSQYEPSDWMKALRSLPPDLIHGDLDSLHDTVRQRYEQIGVEVSQDGDQYSTDFGKCIKKVVERLPDVRDVLVLGSIGGRVDQGIGLLHELYREQVHRHPDVRFWLFSEASVSTLLSPGTTTISTPLESGLITPNIGILPLYGPAVLTTKGLEWDVEDWESEMGGQEVLFTVERAGAAEG
ncbi:thiamine pyrophosphokinase [Friedmanniomyces endolithicus]|nr:thiamine pyrophosphokinase [Friedmanniomyces endolithicus]KAK0776757.1 thiamine pyrophosphokinase [Friedmanniomyces endolithicus]KAK0790929.1 thiamine pyrophosphokinase [Friedmanniomyces endolithicus]KAK0794960.1 thiamine pyrophosphokinase [Friedmanniomyces endolithicus]KAK0840259.1 thiamine pyrophosphokinase [Friedmanniomyces endolithicus]